MVRLSTVHLGECSGDASEELTDHWRTRDFGVENYFKVVLKISNQVRGEQKAMDARDDDADSSQTKP